MSEKRKSIESPKPTTSKFKLKSKRTPKSEENTIHYGETTPKRYGTHSTPIRKSKIINNQEDSPEMDNRFSPVLPCTQQNAVLWSWSPKEEVNNELKTPKRVPQFSKRRIAESPLMFASLKVCVKKPESTVDQFIANFEKFNNQAAVEEPEPLISTSVEQKINEQSTSNADKNLETSEETDIKLVPADDEEEWLIRCSQLVEADLLAKEKESTKSPVIQENYPQNGKQIAGLQELIKTPIGKHKEPKVKPPEKNSIPDDSFDEYLTQVPEEDFKKIESPPKPRPNKFAPKKSLFQTKSSLESVKSVFGLETKKLNTSGDRLFTKTKSFDFCGKTLGKSSAKKIEPVDEKKFDPSPRKFFKSKSCSEPFSKDPSVHKKSSDAYSYSPSVQNNRKIIGKSLECKIFPDSASNQSSSNGSMSSRSSENVNSFDNVPVSNPRFVGQQQNRAKTETQEVLFTAEEIEKKRIEAKMKLEAKRKLQNSRIQTTTKILPLPIIYKR